MDRYFFIRNTVQALSRVKVKGPMVERANDALGLEGPPPQGTAQMRTSVVKSVDLSGTLGEDDLAALDLDGLHGIIGEGSFVENGLKRRRGGFGVQLDSKTYFLRIFDSSTTRTRASARAKACLTLSKFTLSLGDANCSWAAFLAFLALSRSISSAFS